MSRHGTVSRTPAREQPSDTQDDMTALHITPYHMWYWPMSLIANNWDFCPAHSSKWKVTDSTPSRASGSWVHCFFRTWPWCIVEKEDGLLVPAVAKYSTSDVLGRDWREVASELAGRLPQQCKERYRLADTVSELTFVFLCVTFRGSPFLRSSHVLTKDADSADSDVHQHPPHVPHSHLDTGLVHLLSQPQPPASGWIILETNVSTCIWQSR